MKRKTDHNLPRLKITHLVTMEALSKTGSVIAASEQLNVTASAVTHRIRQAETVLGIPLVTQHSSGVALTPEGRLIAEFSAKLLHDLINFESALLEIIDSPESGSDIALPDVLTMFINKK